MKKLIILILIVSLYTSLSQSWEKLEFSAEKYDNFIESDSCIFAQSDVGIHYSDKNNINFDKSKVLHYPDNLLISKRNLLSVYNDTTVIIVLDVETNDSNSNRKVAYKTINNLTKWEDLEIEFNEETKYVNRIVMINDTILIGYPSHTNLNYFFYSTFKFRKINKKWIRNTLFIGSEETYPHYNSINLRSRNDLICLRFNDFSPYLVDVLTDKVDTLNYLLFQLGKSVFYKPVHSFSIADSTYYIVYKDLTSFSYEPYLLKLVNNTDSTLICQLPFKVQNRGFDTDQAFTYLFNKNGVFVIIDLMKQQMYYSTNFGKDWKNDITIPSPIFKEGYEIGVRACLTSNNILFVSEPETSKKQNGYYIQLSPFTNIDKEEFTQYNVTQSTHIELYDILGRSIATYPSYEKLKAEIENYSPPHLIKWRDEKGIYHFEKAK